jgi:hypothetical protein
MCIVYNMQHLHKFSLPATVDIFLKCVILYKKNPLLDFLFCSRFYSRDWFFRVNEWRYFYVAFDSKVWLALK